MRKTVEKDKDEFLELLEELKDFVLIVEGKNDLTALNTLGLYNVIAINGRPHIKVVEHVMGLGKGDEQSSGKPVSVILTDFDKTGREIAGKLNRLFQAYKIHPNSRLRKKVMEF